MGFGWFLIIAPAAWAFAYYLCACADCKFAEAEQIEAYIEEAFPNRNKFDFD
jgi:hypothetical protein